MRANVLVLVGTGLACLVASDRVRADDYAGTPNVPCDRCEDLCKLVDVYLQKEAGIEMWRQYAATTPRNQQTPLPVNIDELGGIQNLVWWEFEGWTRFRRLPCTTAPGGGGGGMSTDLETTTDSKCEIQYNKQPLVGETLHNFELAVNCKELSDSVIEHEKVHQQHCRNAYAKDPATAGPYLHDPHNMAESELKAWTKHRDLVADAIRKLVREHDCGWDPTEGQKADPSSMPTLDQVRAMQQRGWKAVDALSGGQ